MNVTDGQLVRRALEGSELAFGELVDRYRHLVYGVAYHLTGEFESAQDLTQESFVQAYLKLAQLREPDKFGGWLKRIVVNLSRTELRLRNPETVALDDDIPAQAGQASEADIAVRRVLENLGGCDRLAITLHYVDG